MNFSHNATKFYLLTNKPVVFKNEKTKFNLYLPSLENIYTNDDLIFFINFIEKDIEEVKKMVNINVRNHYDFIHMIMGLQNTIESFKELSIIFLNALKVLIPDIHFERILKINNIILDENLFNQIIEVIFMSMDKKIIIVNEDDDEITKKQKEMKLRVQRIRANSKKDKDGLSIEKIISAILYEFPQYKIEDIMNMNLYTVYFLFKNVGKIANYEVSKIAAGNGLAKKHKYFIE